MVPPSNRPLEIRDLSTWASRLDSEPLPPSRHPCSRSARRAAPSVSRFSTVPLDWLSTGQYLQIGPCSTVPMLR